VVRNVGRVWGGGLLLLLALGLLMGCGGGAGGGQTEGTPGGEGAQVDNVVWGTSSQGSAPHVMSVAMADIVNQQTDIAVTVQSVGGSEATIRAINDGNADIGLINVFAGTNAFNGEPPFEQPVDLRLQIIGYTDARQLVVREDSGIETPADLEGKRVIGERPALTEIRMMTDALLEAYDVPPDSVEIISTNETNEALDALRQGTVDAAVLPGAAGSGNLVELSQTADVRWVDLSDRIDEVLEIMGPAFVEGTIPAGTYEGQEQDIVTVGIDNATVVGADVPEETVYTMTKAILESPEALEQAHPLGGEWTIENNMAATPTIPFHPGAIRYYEEAGVWTEEMQNTQDELLQR
jgi:TRAP transporter TAXI family solute receptor